MIAAYSIHEPGLFKLLFMREHSSETGFAESLKDLGNIPQVCQELIQRDYGMPPKEAALMLEQLLISQKGPAAVPDIRASASRVSFFARIYTISLTQQSFSVFHPESLRIKPLFLPAAKIPHICLYRRDIPQFQVDCHYSDL